MGVSIRGLVRDDGGKPLAGVKVLAVHEPTHSLFAKITKDDGSFEFRDVKPGGPYSLTASKAGLTSSQQQLKPRTEEEVTCEFTLEPDTGKAADDELSASS